MACTICRAASRWERDLPRDESLEWDLYFQSSWHNPYVSLETEAQGPGCATSRPRIITPLALKLHSPTKNSSLKVKSSQKKPNQMGYMITGLQRESRRGCMAISREEGRSQCLTHLADSSIMRTCTSSAKQLFWYRSLAGATTQGLSMGFHWGALGTCTVRAGVGAKLLLLQQAARGTQADIRSVPTTTKQSCRDLNHEHNTDFHSAFLLLSIKLKVSSAQLLSKTQNLFLFETALFNTC